MSLLLLLALSAAAEEPKRLHQMTEAEASAALAALRPLAVRERLEKVSELFLGTPYALGPLGEGPEGEFDRDPLVDLRAVDCTTLVEQSMAFALEPDLKKGTKLLQKIRYKGGKVRYETRNHFPETDWLPNLAAAGFLKDITREVAGGVTQTASKLISKRAWYEGKKAEDLKGFDGEPAEARARRLERFQALGRGMKDETASLDYLPIESLPALAERIPSGAVLSLVREDKPEIPVVVSHQALVVDKGGAKYVRHAAAGKTVEDVPLLAYFYRYFGSKWRLVGLNVAALK